jgi:hypothetical protein
MYVLLIVVCPFVLFHLAIVLSVLRYSDSDYPFDIFKDLVTNPVISHKLGKDREVFNISVVICDKDIP